MDGEKRTLLEAFVVDNPDLEHLESLLVEFNIFEAIGAVRQELRHSDFLAFLLDPYQNHGLGDIFLKRLLKSVLVKVSAPPLSAVEIDVADLAGVEVRRERQNIDILIHDAENRLVCAIENKIGAVEHSDQLRRYRETVTRQFCDHRFVFIYLTPEGDAPSDEAYIPVSYERIAELLDAVRQAHESTLGPDVRTLMIHYTAMLRRYIVSNSEIAELCRKLYRQHKQALDLIYEHRPDPQYDLFELLTELVKEADDAHGLIPDYSTKSSIRFAVEDWDHFPSQRAAEGWTPSGRVLLFEFVNAPDQLSLSFIIGPGPQPVRETMLRVFQEHRRLFNLAGGGPNKKWKTVYKKPISNPQDYEEIDFGTIEEKVRREWDLFLTQDLPAIKGAVAEIPWAEMTMD